VGDCIPSPYGVLPLLPLSPVIGSLLDPLARLLRPALVLGSRCLSGIGASWLGFFVRVVSLIAGRVDWWVPPVRRDELRAPLSRLPLSSSWWPPVSPLSTLDVSALFVWPFLDSVYLGSRSGGRGGWGGVVRVPGL